MPAEGSCVEGVDQLSRQDDLGMEMVDSPKGPSPDGHEFPAAVSVSNQVDQRP